jgi:hypothetical protein
MLRPMRPKALIKKKRGVRVYQGEPTEASITAVIDRERKKRRRELMGMTKGIGTTKPA